MTRNKKLGEADPTPFLAPLSPSCAASAFLLRSDCQSRAITLSMFLHSLSASCIALRWSEEGGSVGDGGDAGILQNSGNQLLESWRLNVNFNRVQKESACFMTWGQ